MPEPSSYLDRERDNPFFGGFQASNIVEATIVKVHADEANNVTFTVDVVTIKNELKSRVPLLFPYANQSGGAGIFSIPNVGDKCIVALGAGNIAYVIGFHPSPQVITGRGTPTLAGANGSGASQKGSFGTGNQLVPGAIEMKSPGGNRVLVHPGGSIAIDARTDLFQLFDPVRSTIQALSRSREIFTAGGSLCWREGKEKSKRSMAFEGQLFTKAATKENTEAGPTRGGARMQVVFSEKANHFFLEILDQNDIRSRIAMGPNGVILEASDGTNKGSIVVGPSGNFSFVAGDPLGLHTQLDLAPSAVAITALQGTTPLATVQADTSGFVNISAQAEVLIDAPTVVTQGGLTALAGLGGFPVTRVLDQVVVFGVQGGSGTASGFPVEGSAEVFAAG